MLSALLACSGLVVIACYARAAAADYSSIDYHQLMACGLFAVVPAMFVWASIQAWRFALKGIVSLYSGYLLFGFMGFTASILHWSWSKSIQDIVNAGVSLVAFAIGVLVALQARQFARKGHRLIRDGRKGLFLKACRSMAPIPDTNI